MVNAKEFLGELVKTRRLALDPVLTQKELGKKIGCSQQEISRYEKKERLPPMDIWAKIVPALDLKKEEIAKFLNMLNEEAKSSLNNPVQESPEKKLEALKEQIKNVIKENDVDFDTLSFALYSELSNAHCYLSLNNTSDNKTQDLLYLNRILDGKTQILLSSLESLFGTVNKFDSKIARKLKKEIGSKIFDKFY